MMKLYTSFSPILVLLNYFSLHAVAQFQGANIQYGELVRRAVRDLQIRDAYLGLYDDDENELVARAGKTLGSASSSSSTSKFHLPSLNFMKKTPAAPKTPASPASPKAANANKESPKLPGASSANAHNPASPAGAAAPKRTQSEMSKMMAQKSRLLNPEVDKKYQAQQAKEAAAREKRPEAKAKPAPEGHRLDGKSPAPWYKKLGSAIAHPHQTIVNAKTSAERKKLNFDKAGETPERVKFEEDRAAYSKQKYDRNKPHYDLMAGENAENTHRMQPVANFNAIKGTLPTVFGSKLRRREALEALLENDRRWIEEEFIIERRWDEEEEFVWN